LTAGEVVRRGFAGFVNDGFRHSQTMIEVRRDQASFCIANGDRRFTLVVRRTIRQYDTYVTTAGWASPGKSGEIGRMQ
jgi:hypothetical protein